MSCCDTTHNEEVRELSTLRLVAALFLTGACALLSLTVNITEMEQEAWWLHVTLVALTLGVVVLVSQRWPWQRRWRGSADCSVDLAFMLGIAGASCYSFLSVWRGTGSVYFEVICVLLTIRALGAKFKRSSQRHVVAAMRAATSATCRYRRRSCLTMASEWVTETQLKVGDEIWVPPGEDIPTDGTILAGEAFIDESSMTGDCFWAKRGVNDGVRAGARNIDGQLRIRVESIAPAVSAEAMCDQVLRGVGDKARLQGLAERMAPRFVWSVATIALLVGGYWCCVASWTTGFLQAMAVLLVACPCALGLATPIALWTAVTRLARLGVITRDTGAIERLALVDTMIFDKTGTLTSVALACDDLYMLTQERPDDLMRMLGAAQAASRHPIARAFVTASSAEGESPYRVLSLHQIPGRGIEAEIAGPHVACKLAVLDFDKAAPPSTAATVALASLKVGARPLGIWINDALVAVAAIEERVVTDTHALFARLMRLDVAPAVCSGDQAERLIKLAIPDATGGQSPIAKAQRVDTDQARGRQVCFVGDGVNDALAMAKSRTSFAIANGSPLALAAADFSLAQKHLERLPEIVNVARQSMQCLNSNLVLAAGYNTIGIAAAAMGWLQPVGAACLMLCASLTVILRSMRWLDPA